MSTYEIEIKSLLGNAENALRLKDKITAKGAKLKFKNRQLNHYFILSDRKKFQEKFATLIEESKKDAFNKILNDAREISIRTRDTDGKVLLVLKASIGDDTSSNGVSRLEFEQAMKMSLDNLDERLLDAGLLYQAKWSREREEYTLGDTQICLDKNAGYGYLAEFEKISDNPAQAQQLKGELYSLMSELEVVELPQDRLERMFAFYNSNWRDYYGTDRVFNVE